MRIVIVVADGTKAYGTDNVPIAPEKSDQNPQAAFFWNRGVELANALGELEVQMYGVDRWSDYEQPNEPRLEEELKLTPTCAVTTYAASATVVEHIVGYSGIQIVILIGHGLMDVFGGGYIQLANTTPAPQGQLHSNDLKGKCKGRVVHFGLHCFAQHFSEVLDDRVASYHLTGKDKGSHLKIRDFVTTFKSDVVALAQALDALENADENAWEEKRAKASTIFQRMGRGKMPSSLSEPDASGLYDRIPTWKYERPTENAKGSPTGDKSKTESSSTSEHRPVDVMDIGRRENSQPPFESDFPETEDGPTLARTGGTVALPHPVFRVLLWNVCDLGGGLGGYPAVRPKSVIDASAEFIVKADADFVALLEVKKHGGGALTKPQLAHDTDTNSNFQTFVVATDPLLNKQGVDKMKTKRDFRKLVGSFIYELVQRAVWEPALKGATEIEAEAVDVAKAVQDAADQLNAPNAPESAPKETDPPPEAPPDKELVDAVKKVAGNLAATWAGEEGLLARTWDGQTLRQMAEQLLPAGVADWIAVEISSLKWPRSVNRKKGREVANRNAISAMLHAIETSGDTGAPEYPPRGKKELRPELDAPCAYAKRARGVVNGWSDYGKRVTEWGKLSEALAMKLSEDLSTEVTTLKGQIDRLDAQWKFLYAVLDITFDFLDAFARRNGTTFRTRDLPQRPTSEADRFQWVREYLKSCEVIREKAYRAALVRYNEQLEAQRAAGRYPGLVEFDRIITAVNERRKKTGKAEYQHWPPASALSDAKNAQLTEEEKKRLEQDAEGEEGTEIQVSERGEEELMSVEGAPPEPEGVTERNALARYFTKTESYGLLFDPTRVQIAAENVIYANTFLKLGASKGFLQREPIIAPAKVCGVDLCFVAYHACAPLPSHETERPHDFALLVDLAKKLRADGTPGVLLSDTNIDTNEEAIKYWSGEAKTASGYFQELTGETKLPLRSQGTSLKKTTGTREKNGYHYHACAYDKVLRLSSGNAKATDGKTEIHLRYGAQQVFSMPRALHPPEEAEPPLMLSPPSTPPSSPQREDEEPDWRTEGIVSPALGPFWELFEANAKSGPDQFLKAGRKLSDHDGVLAEFWLENGPPVGATPRAESAPPKGLGGSPPKTGNLPPVAVKVRLWDKDTDGAVSSSDAQKSPTSLFVYGDKHDRKNVKSGRKPPGREDAVIAQEPNTIGIRTCLDESTWSMNEGEALSTIFTKWVNQDIADIRKELGGGNYTTLALPWDTSANDESRLGRGVANMPLHAPLAFAQMQKAVKSLRDDVNAHMFPGVTHLELWDYEKTKKGWGLADAKQDPKRLFVFGDNDERKNVEPRKPGGIQAVIAAEPNAFGVRTCLYAVSTPSPQDWAMMEGAHPEAMFKRWVDEDVAAIEIELRSGRYAEIVLPWDIKNDECRLGTGHAQMNKYAPKTFAYLQGKMKALKRSVESGRFNGPQHPSSMPFDTRGDDRRDPRPEAVRAPLVGIQNRGENACYVNSVLQFLYAIDMRANYAIDWDGTEGDIHEERTAALRGKARDCLTRLGRVDEGTVNVEETRAFRQALFPGAYKAQQDAHEALTRILDALDVDRRLDAGPQGLQTALLNGSLAAKVPSKMHFLVEREDTHADAPSQTRLELHSVLILNIADIADSLSMDQIVRDTWDFNCPDVAESDVILDFGDGRGPRTVRRTHEKTRFHGAAPDRLLVQVKRFQPNRGGDGFDKIATSVTGAHVMTVPDVESPYDLQAFIVHTGDYYGGHYRAYVKRPEGWFEADDESVRPGAGLEGDLAKGYLFYYRRRVAPPPEGGEQHLEGPQPRRDDDRSDPPPHSEDKSARRVVVLLTALDGGGSGKSGFAHPDVTSRPADVIPIPVRRYAAVESEHIDPSQLESDKEKLARAFATALEKLRSDLPPDAEIEIRSQGILGDPDRNALDYAEEPQRTKLKELLESHTLVPSKRKAKDSVRDVKRTKTEGMLEREPLAEASEQPPYSKKLKREDEPPETEEGTDLPEEYEPRYSKKRKWEDEPPETE